MKTSHTQYVIMVEFMERNGDLSKPSGGRRGRHYIKRKWSELISKLNSDGTGDSRSEDKWRKVWSDLKNNTKKKWAKINRAASGTGGGQALQLSLTDLENRVMQIIGVQAAAGMAIEEAGFQQGEENRPPIPQAQDEEVYLDAQIYLLPEEATEDRNTPGSSNQPTAPPPVNRDPPSSPIVINQEEPWNPPAQKKKKYDDATKLFVECDRKAREYARERDVVYESLERERLRLREFEIRERVRQRRLQAQWLAFMKEALNVINRYFERENK